jgi:cytochrome c oxidase subunit II
MKMLKSATLACALAFLPVVAIAQEAPVAAPTAVAAEAPKAVIEGTLPTKGIGQPVDAGIGLQTQVTPDGQQAQWMHDVLLMPIITLISLFVLGLLFWVSFRFRRAANPVASKTSHNTFIEIVWTLVPVIILVVISIPSIQLLAQQYKPAGKGAITVKATGNQWYWSYNYPDYGDFEVVANMLKEKGDVVPGERFRTEADGPRLLATDNRILIPVNTPIKLITTSNDVIHSWAMPAFWSKMDAVPGRLNEIKFTAEREGVYFGQCSELCGARHGFMPIAVEVVSKAKFEAWIASKGGKLPGAVAPAAATPAVAPATVPEAPKIETPAAPAPVASPAPAATK